MLPAMHFESVAEQLVAYGAREPDCTPRRRALFILGHFVPIPEPGTQQRPMYCPALDLGRTICIVGRQQGGHHGLPVILYTLKSEFE